MAINYRISYQDSLSNTRTIDLLPGDDGVRVDWRTEINRNVASTGIYENVIQNTMRFITFDCYFQESTFHKLETWIAQSQQGVPFAFSKNSTLTPYTQLASSQPGNSTVYTVGAGLADQFADCEYVIVHDALMTKWDVAAVASAAGTTVNTVEPSEHTYSTGDFISWYYYFNALLLLDDKFDPDRDGAFWHHKFNCVEVLHVS